MMPTEKRIRFYNYSNNLEESEIVLCGIPYEIENEHLPLASQTKIRNTNFIREASIWLEDNAIATPTYYSKIKVHDAGDIKSIDDLIKFSELIKKMKKTPLFFGGPHVYTYYPITIYKPRTLIVLDAHLDSKEKYLGEEFNSATFIRRIYREKLVNKIIIVGARAYEEEEYMFVQEADKIIMCNPSELKEHIPTNEEIYLSIDLDFLDSSYISETPYPEAWGYTPHDITNILKTLVEKNVKVVGADVSEFIPIHTLHHQAALAARIILETAALIKYTSGKSR